MAKNVLLLGNGINDVTNSYKWMDLIDDIVNFLEIKNINGLKEKPFPLLYEEIFLTNLRGKKVSELKIKSFIAEKIKRISPNKVHELIKSLNPTDIITTNYDYTIEKSLGSSGSILSDKGVVKQNLYSIFRHTEGNGCKVWHIHGELNRPNSILLGYEQYSGQLQQMRNYIALGTGDAYKKQFPPLIKQLKKGKVDNNSWLDIFFTQDIHIVGLSLDFIELDLWWLLTFRARRVLENRFSITNKIVYYYPQSLEKKIQNKLEILRANEVKTEAYGNAHNIEYYQDVFKAIKESSDYGK
jgi:hypothetical protein